MFDLLDVDEGCIHGVLTRHDRVDQVVHLLVEFVIGHDSYNLIVFRLV